MLIITLNVSFIIYNKYITITQFWTIYFCYGHSIKILFRVVIECPSPDVGIIRTYGQHVFVFSVASDSPRCPLSGNLWLSDWAKTRWPTAANWCASLHSPFDQIDDVQCQCCESVWAVLVWNVWDIVRLLSVTVTMRAQPTAGISRLYIRYFFSHLNYLNCVLKGYF